MMAKRVGYIFLVMAGSMWMALPAVAITIDDFISINDPGSALLFEFVVIDAGPLPNSPDADLIGIDLGLAVSVQNGKILFEIANASTSASAIAAIYFDDSTSRGGSPLIANGAIHATAGSNVSFFVGPGSPSNMPAANNLDPAFVANTALSAHAHNPVPSRGLNPGENLVLSYDYLVAPALVGEALLDGTLRLGLHVRSIGDAGESDAFVIHPFDTPSTPQAPIPEPASVLLLGIGGAMLALRKRRSNI